MDINTDYKNFTNQKQWKAYIQKLLYTNQKALLKALIVLYNYQESDEQLYGVSIHHNNMGFSKIDGEILSPIAKKYISGKTITLHEFYTIQSRVPKYWKQIMLRMKAKMQKDKDAGELYVVEDDGQLCYWWCKA